MMLTSFSLQHCRATIYNNQEFDHVHEVIGDEAFPPFVWDTRGGEDTRKGIDFRSRVYKASTYQSETKARAGSKALIKAGWGDIVKENIAAMEPAAPEGTTRTGEASNSSRVREPSAMAKGTSGTRPARGIQAAPLEYGSEEPEAPPASLMPALGERNFLFLAKPRGDSTNLWRTAQTLRLGALEIEKIEAAGE